MAGNTSQWCVFDGRGDEIICETITLNFRSVSQMEVRVCHSMSPFQSAFSLAYPTDPPNPALCHNPSTNLERSLVPSRSSFFPEGGGTEIKTIQPCRCYPLKISSSACLNSPVLIPSRMLNYKFPAASPFRASTNSTMSVFTNAQPWPPPLSSSPLMAKHPQSARSNHCLYQKEERTLVYS